MTDFKKYKRVSFFLLAVILAVFLSIFWYLFIINDEKNNLTPIVNNLYFLNSILLISVLSIITLFSFWIRKLKQNRLELPKEDNEITPEMKMEIFTELNNKKIMEMLSTIEKSISAENTNEKKWEVFLKHLVTQTESVQAALFLTTEKDHKKILQFVSGYAFYVPEENPVEFHFGEGLSGQVAVDKKLLNLSGIKVDRLPVYSGMGSSIPQNLIICPVLLNNETTGIIELASFKKYEQKDELLIEQAALLLGNFSDKSVINEQKREATNE